MDILEFIAALVENLVWPLTVIVAIFVFRGPISNLLPFLQRLRYKDFVIEFHQKLDKVQAQTTAMAGESIEDSAEGDLLKLALDHPRDAVIESWFAVARAIHDLAESQDTAVDISRGRPTLAIGRDLARSGVIEPQMMSFLQELRSIRNDVAHRLDVPLTPEMVLQYVPVALKYVSVASRVIVALEESSSTHT